MGPAEFVRELKEILGDRGVVSDAQALAPFLAERRGRFQGRAELVALPESTRQVAEVVRVCARAGVGIVPQGGNTGLVCGTVSRADQLVLSLARMNSVLAIDAANHTMTVQAGCILADAQSAAEEHGLLLPLSLAAEGSCRLGGNLSTNAGGTQVLHYGNARDLVLGIEAVLPDGRIWNGLRGLRKDNRGYDLKHLFIGGEGTLGVITAAVCKLYPRPRVSVTALLAVADAQAAVTLLGELRSRTGDAITSFEYMDASSLRLVAGGIPDCRYPFTASHAHHVLIECDSPASDVDLRTMLERELSSAMESGLVEDAVLAGSVAQSRALWRLRESIPEAQTLAGLGIKHDVSVPVSRMPEFLSRAGRAVEAIDPRLVVVAFGHVGDGNMHYNINQPRNMPAEEFLGCETALHESIYAITDELEGSFSAEHGIGRLKREELLRYKSPVELDMMRAVKRALDPQGIMNPGVLFEST